VTLEFPPFDNAITFQCTGLPRGTTATFAPTSVTPGAAAAVTSLTLRTTARTGSAAGRTMASPGGGPGGSGLLFAVASVLFAAAALRWGRTRRLVRGLLAAGAVAGLALLISSCSTGGGDGNNTGTPAGTYQVMVRGVSGSLTVSTTVELVVR
jgi:hypothetical protein